MKLVGELDRYHGLDLRGSWPTAQIPDGRSAPPLALTHAAPPLDHAEVAKVAEKGA